MAARVEQVAVHEPAGATQRRAGPPLGPAFVGFVAAIAVLSTLAFLAPTGPDRTATANQLGVVATTLFATSGLLCAYRAITAGTRVTILIAAVLLGPGAVWTWLVFVAGSAASPHRSSFVVLASSGLSMLLLGRGLRSARWIEVFSGLGSLGLSLAAGAVRLDPVGAGGGAVVALLTCAAGMACLYGLLVDIELAEHRRHRQLVGVEHEARQEVERNEDLLHDLRSGLLSIEAAVGTFDGALAGSVRNELARLRALTAREPTIEAFDLVRSVGQLVDARRARGVDIDLRAPDRAHVVGDRAEIVSIIDNLVSNAERHGRAPVTVALISCGSSIEVLVTDRGRGVRTEDTERIFDRGVSTHPDGLGLGLSLARRLAERNDAEVALRTSTDRETTFMLRLGAASPVTPAR